MQYSQNGWPISPSMNSLTVAGAHFGGVRTGDVFTVLRYVATRFNDEVEPLIDGQCGGYNLRKISGTDTWSNHASATAIDINWNVHPQGERDTFSSAKQARIRAIINDCNGAVRWGGDYSGTNDDDMHFEIHGSAVLVNTLATRIEEEMASVDLTPASVTAVAAESAGKLGTDLAPQNHESGVAKGVRAQVKEVVDAALAALVPTLVNALVPPLTAAVQGASSGASAAEVKDIVHEALNTTRLIAGE